METTTKTATVNGKLFTVTKAGQHVVEMVGPRGGEAMLVQNKNSGRWVLIEGNGMNPRVSPVKTMEVR